MAGLMFQNNLKGPRRIGEVVQLVGLVMLGAGIAIEIAYQANVWLVLITVGSIVFAIGTKLKGV